MLPVSKCVYCVPSSCCCPILLLCKGSNDILVGFMSNYSHIKDLAQFVNYDFPSVVK